ncbi:enoyl-CoA hydratase family protein [Jongsikchunia kroppenstedtii]|uniref:enoyl-CoA hydratase family protein n=1 Tax=Jongsikchunia kroppenstedtii TaxID=1121721 RepID=UPI00037B65B8|nr:enoyl-CoA hydratase family protein [Jongsikchunia kroppenstedtii]
MSDEIVHLRVESGVATVTLDSPKNRNAISSRLVTELTAQLAAAAADPAARLVVLTHTGGTFCAGADLTEAMASGQSIEEASDSRTRSAVDLMRTIIELPKPVIAKIDGHVRAGGMGIVGACDIAVAGPSSTFALTEARLGVAASIISLTLLPRMSSRAASRYYLTGEKFDAATAERIGLITIAADDADAAVGALAAEIRQGSPQGLAESKKLVTAPILREFDAHAADLAALSGRLFRSDEARTGMQAFLSKQSPPWATSADD